MIGTTISHYRITAKLGEGGMGVVYKAEDLRLERPVALKFLSPAYYDVNDKERLLREARTAALIHHPNICPIYDVEEADGQLFFAMAYLEGETLGRLLNRNPFEPSRAIHIATQILDGLEEAHRHHVVHRDIKSNNIVVSAEGHAYVLDFGLAISSNATRMTAAGSVTGTPAYMSPEQAEGGPVDRRTDVWSVGVVLFEMLSGQLPFKRGHAVAVLHAILYDPLPSLAQLRPGVPLELVQVVEKALAKKPENRWQSAREMAAALHRLHGGDSSQQTAGMLSPSPLVQSWWTRRAVMGGGLAALLLASALGTGWWLGGFTPGATLPRTKHIAVLPFQVIGQDEGVRATTDGLVELLTAQLSQLDELPGDTLVVPASEIRSRKIESAGDARKIYGANLVITGSAQRLNDLIQFTVTLVDAVHMRQLGAQSFDFDARNPIALRDGALSQVLNLLKLQLSPEGHAGARQGETAVPAAYAAYLQGTGYLARYDLSQNIDRAIASFQSAVAQDASYAEAYAGLAQAYLRKATRTGEKEWSDRAVESAVRAARIAPNLAAVHATLGRIYGTVGREDEAIHEFQLALRIAPGDVGVYRDLAEVLANLGRFTEAEGLYLEAVKRRPSDWYGHVLLGLFYKGREQFPEAEKAYKRAIELTPDNVIAYRLLGSLYKAEGKYAQAVDELKKALKIQRSALVYSVLGVSYYYERKFKEAAGALETAVDLDAARYTFWGNLGMSYQKLPGQKEKAEPALKRAIELAGKMLSVTAKDYSIRGDMAEYWARLGDSKQAEQQLEQIPPAFREKFAGQRALVYELLGKRQQALESLSQVKTTSALADLKNDPDLSRLWEDPALRRK